MVKELSDMDYVLKTVVAQLPPAGEAMRDGINI